MFALCGPQKLPALTEPVTVRRAASTFTVAAALPLSEFDVRKSMVAGFPAGKPNWPVPVRAVVVSAAEVPLSRPTR